MTDKPFPITKGLPCKLKWNHSTVFLTMGTTASCHRVNHDPIEIVDGRIEFHNIAPKIEARKKMLRGEWPGRGCEHCKLTEDAGGHSDRMNHLTMPRVYHPHELDQDPTAVSVTPTQLEIYFSNTCNLKCVYCCDLFSSTIQQENRKHGEFLWGQEGDVGKNVHIPTGRTPSSDMDHLTAKLFEWLEQNIGSLRKIIILGGEPFLQKETEKLIEFLENHNNPQLDLVVFSNLTVDPARVQRWLARMSRLLEQNKINNLQVIGSLDCWGDQAEYIRNGLDLKKFIDNFEYMLNETNIVLSINSALTPLSVPTMPDMVSQINEWSKIRTVYWSMMKAGEPNRPFLHPTIFGHKILELGINQSIEMFDTQEDPIKIGYLNNLKGIAEECRHTEPDLHQQKCLKVYFEELDRRRNTNFHQLFPTISQLLQNL